ncbi:hypothetical protein NZK33_07890 [Cyanobium sp. FGCU-6]|jgi:hypothetical protein|nr:hypothetical protein [Cyanobium sp. FGCU6]
MASGDALCCRLPITRNVAPGGNHAIRSISCQRFSDHRFITAYAIACNNMISLLLIPLFLWSGLLGFGANPGEFQTLQQGPRSQPDQVWLVANGASQQRSIHSAPMSSAYAAQPGDALLRRGDVNIEKVTVAEMVGEHGQLVTITGSLPTPCHRLRLRIPAMASADGVLRITAWSISDPAEVCAQMLQPFTVRFPIKMKAASRISVNDVMRW